MALLSDPKLLISVFSEDSTVVPSWCDHDWKLNAASMDTNELTALDHWSLTQGGHNHAPYPNLRSDEIVVGWSIWDVPYISCTYYANRGAGTLSITDGSVGTSSSHWSCIQPFFSDITSTTSRGSQPKKLRVNAIVDLLEKVSSCSLEEEAWELDSRDLGFT